MKLFLEICQSILLAMLLLGYYAFSDILEQRILDEHFSDAGVNYIDIKGSRLASFLITVFVIMAIYIIEIICEEGIDAVFRGIDLSPDIIISRSPSYLRLFVAYTTYALCELVMAISMQYILSFANILHLSDDPLAWIITIRGVLGGVAYCQVAKYEQKHPRKTAPNHQ